MPAGAKGQRPQHDRILQRAPDDLSQQIIVSASLDFWTWHPKQVSGPIGHDVKSTLAPLWVEAFYEPPFQEWLQAKLANAEFILDLCWRLGAGKRRQNFDVCRTAHPIAQL